MRTQFHLDSRILKCTSCSYNSVKIIQFGIKFKFCHGIIFIIIVLITHIIVFIWIISDRIWIWDQTGCWHCWNSTWSIFYCLNFLISCHHWLWLKFRTVKSASPEEHCILSLRNCRLPVVGAPRVLAKNSLLGALATWRPEWKMRVRVSE